MFHACDCSAVRCRIAQSDVGAVRRAKRDSRDPPPGVLFEDRTYPRVWSRVFSRGCPLSHNEPPTLIAVQVAEPHGMRLMPGSAHREWMSSTPFGFARRCLPMLMANQHGWVLLNGVDLDVTWDGSAGASGITISCATEASEDGLPVSHFGDGVLTWRLPFLFQSPPDTDILLRGPANLPKDGAAPLEGLIESDWSPASSTMNWKLTRPGLTVRFSMDEPLAMIVPMPRGHLERFQAQIRGLEEDPELEGRYHGWRTNRETFLKTLEPRQRRRDEWQGDYFRGQIGTERPQGSEPHRTRLQLNKFAPKHHSPDSATQDEGTGTARA